MKKRRPTIILVVLAVAFVLSVSALVPALVYVYFGLVRNAHAHLVATVCVDTGLKGAADQENKLYCNINAINNVVTDAAPSTYQQAIHVAQQKNIVVGYPVAITQTVNWSGVAVTDVEFSRGYHAEHFNPSRGVVTIYDPFDRVVYSGR